MVGHSVCLGKALSKQLYLDKKFHSSNAHKKMNTRFHPAFIKQKIVIGPPSPIHSALPYKERQHHKAPLEKIDQPYIKWWNKKKGVQYWK